MIQAGETLRIIEPHPEWTIRRGFREIVFERDNLEALLALGELPSLFELWRERFPARVDRLRSKAQSL